MNAQLQRQPAELESSIPRSSARPATPARASVQLSPPAAEDRPSPKNAQRVDPLWMITAAAALLFAFLLAAMSFD